MKLQDIKGSYNAIYSLGDLCLASIQLKQNNLRTFAGVLDWAGSPILPDVTRLLQNRFAGLMDAQICGSSDTLEIPISVYRMTLIILCPIMILR